MEENKLNIGCGKSHLPGYVNMDISDFCGPDIQHDIRKGFPMFEDNQMEHVIANGVLEMVLPNEEFLFVMNELWRIIKPSGRINGQVPSTDHRVLCLDPFDRRWFQVETFMYWWHGQHHYNEFGTQYGFEPWDVHDCEENNGGIICFEMSPHKDGLQ